MSHDQGVEQLRAAVLQGAQHWETVGRVVTAADSREEAVSALCDALGISPLGAQAVLDQPVSRWLRSEVAALEQELA